MKISVIVNVHKETEDMLTACIKSIAKQSFKDFEVIFVLDNCTDDLIDWVKGISEAYWDEDKYKLVVRDRGDNGIGAARQAGLNASSGEWIAFCSGDDLIYPNFLRDMLDESTGVKAVYCDYDRIKSNGEVFTTTKEMSYTYEDFCIRMWRACIVNLGATLIAKEVYDKVGGFDESLKLGEDYLFYLKAMRHYQFKHTPKILVAYRVHSGQTTQEKIKDIASNDIKIKATAMKYWSEKHD